MASFWLDLKIWMGRSWYLSQRLVEGTSYARTLPQFDRSWHQVVCLRGDRRWPGLIRRSSSSCHCSTSAFSSVLSLAGTDHTYSRHVALSLLHFHYYWQLNCYLHSYLNWYSYSLLSRHFSAILSYRWITGQAQYWILCLDYPYQASIWPSCGTVGHRLSVMAASKIKVEEQAASEEPVLVEAVTSQRCPITISIHQCSSADFRSITDRWFSILAVPDVLEVRCSGQQSLSRSWKMSRRVSDGLWLVLAMAKGNRAIAQSFLPLRSRHFCPVGHLPSRWAWLGGYSCRPLRRESLGHLRSWIRFQRGLWTM